MRRRISALVALASALSAGAWANGRYPSAGQILQSPSQPQHLVARATYGLLQSADGGASWQWLCETVIGVGGQYDPFLAISAADRIVAATDVGISVSDLSACTWTPAQEPDSPTHLPAIDLVTDPTNTARVVVLSQAPDEKHARLLESLDSGATWHTLGAPLPDTVVGLTLEIAPSQPSRLYVSGRANPDESDHVVVRSDDNGGTWQRLSFNPVMLDDAGVPLPAAQTQVVGTYIGAVDPKDADSVWLRVRRSTQPDQLWRSQDGGHTWQRVFQASKGRLFGFALSPDGQQVAVGTTMPTPGVFRANVADLHFSQVSTVGAFCLKWLASGLYVCADDNYDGFALGVSHDAGATFAPLFRLQDATPLACAAGTSVAATCPAEWPDIARILGAGASAPQAAPKSSCQAAPSGSATAFVVLVAILLVHRRRRAK